MDCSMPDFPVHHQLLDLAQTHVHQVSDAIQPSHHYHPLLIFILLPLIFPSIRVFSNGSVLRIRWPKDWSVSFNISPSNEFSRLKGMTEDEIIGWHHQLNGHEFEQGPGVGDGQGSLVTCCPWGYKVSDTTE